PGLDEPHQHAEVLAGFFLVPEGAAVRDRLREAARAAGVTVDALHSPRPLVEEDLLHTPAEEVEVRENGRLRRHELRVGRPDPGGTGGPAWGDHRPPALPAGLAGAAARVLRQRMVEGRATFGRARR